MFFLDEQKDDNTRFQSQDILGRVPIAAPPNGLHELHWRTPSGPLQDLQMAHASSMCTCVFIPGTSLTSEPLQRLQVASVSRNTSCCIIPDGALAINGSIKATGVGLATGLDCSDSDPDDPTMIVSEDVDVRNGQLACGSLFVSDNNRRDSLGRVPIAGPLRGHLQQPSCQLPADPTDSLGFAPISTPPYGLDQQRKGMSTYPRDSLGSWPIAAPPYGLQQQREHM